MSAALVAPRPEADHVMIHCYGGYTTNMRLSELLEADASLLNRISDYISNNIGSREPHPPRSTLIQRAR